MARSVQLDLDPRRPQNPVGRGFADGAERIYSIILLSVEIQCRHQFNGWLLTHKNFELCFFFNL